MLNTCAKLFDEILKSKTYNQEIYHDKKIQTFYKNVKMGAYIDDFYGYEMGRRNRKRCYSNLRIATSGT